MMGGYTVLTIPAIVPVVAVELAWARTGLYRRSTFWITMLIMWGFQIPVDGWLTHGAEPIVRYASDDFSGLRVFFDSPIEDFGFAFALVSLSLSIWLRLGSREASR